MYCTFLFFGTVLLNLQETYSVYLQVQMIEKIFLVKPELFAYIDEFYIPSAFLCFFGA
jgi:hypothetical protein